MRITGEHARAVSEWAHRLSNGYVAVVDTGTDIGQGSRIFDGNSGHVWRGEPREATAYYLGQADVFCTARGVALADWPAGLAEVRAELRGGPVPPSVDEWYSVGWRDATSRLESYCPEIKDAGVPRA